MTNEITLLKALKDGATINPKFQPQNNKQAYLAYLCGLDIALPEPRTAEEILLCKLCVDNGKYLHTMTIRTYLGKITMTLKNNSAESLTGVYKENTDIFNGATLMILGEDIGRDEDFYATVIGYEGGDSGILMIDKDFPFPVIGSIPNAIDVMSGEVIDTVTTKDGGKLEQEKKVEVTQNGVTEIFPDDGYTLSKVTANVNVKASGGENKLAQFAGGTLKVITAEDLKGITTIKKQAFYGETSLETLEIGNNIKTIEESAFRSCSNLTSVTIGSGIEIIGQSAFEGNKITVVNIDDLAKWCKIYFPGAYSTPACQGNANVFIKNSNGAYEPATDVVIPNTVTFLNQYTFAYWKGLESVIIPKGVTGIGPYVFYGCRDLISVTIPEGVERIEFFAFYGCSSITSLTIPSSVTQISTLDIGSETNKATVTFLRPTPINITSAFFNTARIEKIIVPKGCGEAYKTATNWANFADLIEESAE